MLRRIRVEDLKEGMIFSEPLFFDDGKNRVLGKMHPVTQRELAVLKQWKVPFVMTEGKAVRSDAEMNDLVEELDALVDEEEDSTGKQSDKIDDSDILKLPDVLNHSELYSEYLSIVDAVDAFLNDIKQKKPISPRPVDGIALRLHNLLAADRTLVISFILTADIPEHDMAKALVDSAILAETLAVFMKEPADYRDDVVLAALLHDCGMLRIPDTILQKKGPLSDTEMQTVAAHTVYGYKAVLSEFMYTERVAQFVLQHHERWDGKGYPGRLNKEGIELGARIISVVDAFVAMTSAKVYRSALLGYDAMKTFLADKGRRFDYQVVKALIQSIGVYPIGSIVLMNDTSIARVIDVAPEEPLRPLIRVLIDESGKKFLNNTGRLLNLRDCKNIFIVRAVDPQQYQKK
ncbi:HD-GYP domain-containing protein [Treponema sp.]|uniref:HD-GYP domain-containing protein n=1 Tax=Treponema sp. TaxID=166 RepID=UPI003FA251CC